MHFKSSFFRDLILPLCVFALLVGICLPGCGASLGDVTASGLATSNYTAGTLQKYCVAYPADANNAAALATTALTLDATAIADAQAMPSNAQIQADAATCIQIIGELVAVIPDIIPVFSAQARAEPLNEHQRQVYAKWYDLTVRLHVGQAELAKHRKAAGL